jgi:hypothetical protein
VRPVVRSAVTLEQAAALRFRVAVAPVRPSTAIGKPIPTGAYTPTQTIGAIQTILKPLARLRSRTQPSLVKNSKRVSVGGDALLHPVAAASIALLLLNDHVLKASSPGVLTGKASDFAGLAFFPLVLLSAWELASTATRRWKGPSLGSLLVATIATSVAFVAVKATDVGNAAAGVVLGWLQWVGASTLAAAGLVGSPQLRPAAITQDPSDLIALAALAVCLAVGIRRITNARRDEGA